MRDSPFDHRFLIQVRRHRDERDYSFTAVLARDPTLAAPLVPQPWQTFVILATPSPCPSFQTSTLQDPGSAGR
jgi:hypothetical protein